MKHRMLSEQTLTVDPLSTLCLRSPKRYHKKKHCKRDCYQYSTSHNNLQWSVPTPSILIQFKIKYIFPKKIGVSEAFNGLDVVTGSTIVEASFHPLLFVYHDNGLLNAFNYRFVPVYTICTFTSALLCKLQGICD